MSYLKNYQAKSGFTKICGIGDAGLELIEFGILKLEPGERYTMETPDREVALVILGGTCRLRWDEKSPVEIGGRQDVFSGKPHCAYLPAPAKWEVEAISAVEIAWTASPAEPGGEPVIITPDEVAEVHIGKNNFQRDAYMILTDKVPARHLFIGEAFVPSGNHASFPPHRHDFDRPPAEVNMEEIYFFRFNPPNGYGLQRIYTDDGEVDFAAAVRHNDTILIPRGYHPVVNTPGYTMYYLWIMAGRNHRQFLQTLDPEHKWVLEC